MESVAARIRREAVGKVSTNVMVRDLDVAVPSAVGGRRLEVVVDGLPLFGGGLLVVDTTMVCVPHANGTAHRGATHKDGVPVVAAKRRKEFSTPNWWGLGIAEAHGHLKHKCS